MKETRTDRERAERRCSRLLRNGVLGLGALLGISCGSLKDSEVTSIDEPLMADTLDAGVVGSDLGICNLIDTRQLLAKIVKVDGREVLLEIKNDSSMEASVSIMGTSQGDGGRGESLVRSWVTSAGSTTVVSIGVKELAPMQRGDVKASKVHITAHAEFADGSRETSLAETVYVDFSSGRALLSPTASVGIHRPEILGLLSNEAAALATPIRFVHRALVPPGDLRDGDPAEELREDEPSAGRLPVAAKGQTAQSVYDLLGAQSLTSATESIYLCFNITTQYTDGGNGEDYWQITTPVARPAIRNRITLTNLSAPYDTIDYGLGYGSDDHCQQFDLQVPGIYEIKMWAMGWPTGSPGGREVEVRDNATTGSPMYHTSYYLSYTGDDEELEIDPTGESGAAALNIYLAAAQAVRGHSGIGSTHDVIIRRAGCPGSGGACYHGDSGVVYTPGSDKKWTIAHEVGHRIHSLAAALPDSVFDCSMSASSPCHSAAGNVHELRSKEYQSCSYVESFAEFYAADAFNNHNQTDCVYQSGDCDYGSVQTPVRWFEQKCETPHSGRGSEIDWLRVLWNMHTDSTACSGSNPSMNSMLQWMEDADDGTSGWSATNVYTRLNDEANQVGGAVNCRWDYHKEIHGIDHPWNTEAARLGRWPPRGYARGHRRGLFARRVRCPTDNASGRAGVGCAGLGR